MYLHEVEIKEAVKQSNLIENFKEKNLGCIAYDLTISKIFANSNEYRQYTLAPGESVFISPDESINLPNDCFCEVIQRNSSIRQGLTVTAPVYQPGHHTKVFFRIQNISNDGIYLKSGDSVSSIRFYKFSTPVEHPYDGVYADEFEFMGVGDFHPVSIPEVTELDDKLQSIQDLEKSIYNNVLVLMSIFVAVFSLINFNINILSTIDSFAKFIIFNIMMISIIMILVSLLTMVVAKKNSEKFHFARNMIKYAICGIGISLLLFLAILQN